MKTLKLVLLILFLCSAKTITSQTQLIDSLKIAFKKSNDEKQKAKILGDLTWYYRAISTDSSLKYGTIALEILSRIDDSQMLAQQLSDMGAVYLFKGDIKNSKRHYLKALDLRRKKKDTLGIAKINANLSTIYLQIQKIDSAMIFSIEAMKIFEERGYVDNALIIKSNVANMYEKLNNYDKALQTNKEVLEVYKKKNNIFRQANVLANMGKTYLYKQDTAYAIASFKESIKLGKQSNNNKTLGVAFANLGNIYMLQGAYTKAIKPLKESLKVRTLLNSEFDIASLNLTLGLLYLKTGKIKLSKSHFTPSLAYFEKNNIPDKLSIIYQSAALINAYEKNFKKMNFYLVKGELLSNTYYSEEIKKQVLELEAKYETEKKEKEISQQKEQILANELVIKNRSIYAILLGSVLLLVTLFSYNVYRKNQFKRKQLQKELDLKDALATIKTQNRLQEQRLRISRDLHDNIGSQLTFIISSIDNLKFITKDAGSILKEKLQHISTFTSDTIFQLRDTIWAMNKNKITLEDLHTRILSFIEKAKSATKDIEFTFNQEIEEDLGFSSLKGINIFRVIQESINNAIKYSEATNITINICIEHTNLIISVIDNGVGFDMKTTVLGNGLSNMEKRMSEIGGIIKINSKIKKGTSIQIICTL